MGCRFDADTHAYFIGRHRVPSVTQVLRDILPGWMASEFFLGRGQAVHACAAMVARGIAFEHDPRIAGQVEAAKKFYREVQPEIIAIEEQVYSHRYQYAGTLDLMCRMGVGRDRLTIVDFKASLTDTIPFQCAAYALARIECEGSAQEWITRWSGVGVELREDGTYRMSERVALKSYARDWLHLLGAYNVRAKLGLTKGADDDGH